MENERSFNTVLAEAEDGKLVADLTTQYRKLINVMAHEAAARNTGVVGSLSLKLNFSLRDGVVEMIPEVKVDEPKPKRMRSIFWPDKFGNISRKNPHQNELPLRQVAEEIVALRTVVGE